MMRPVMPLSHELLEVLSDGAPHSYEALTTALRCTPILLAQSVDELRALGIEVTSSDMYGCCLGAPVELLSVDRMNAVVAEFGGSRASFEVLASVDSTNSEVARKPLGALPQTTFCFAEMQTRGRGRKGRSWVSPYACDLCFSVGCRFSGRPDKLLGLSLAVGVMVIDVLESLGYEGLSLKWPNDLFWHGRKLGGILIELEGDREFGTRATIGVGINVSMSSRVVEGIEQEWVDLAEIQQGWPPRNRLAGALIVALSERLQRFDTNGWPHFSARWAELDCCRGRQVRIVTPASVETGRALGVDEHGNLVVETSAGRQVCQSGDVSLRRLT